MARNADDTDIEVDYDEVSGEQRGNSIVDAAIDATDEDDSEMLVDVDEAASQCDMLARPAFTSRFMQNIPVRPRKGIPHLDNYCLFDPSTDFVNEKELKRQQQLLNEKVYEKLDDIEEERETECGNYVTVDPETPPSDVAATLHEPGDVVAHGPTTLVRINKTASVNNFMSIGGNRPVALKTATKIEKLFRQSSLPTVVVSHRNRGTESSSALLQRENVAKQLPPKHLPLRTNNGPGVTPHAIQPTAGAVDALKHSVSSPQLNYAKDRRNKFHAPIEPIYMLYNSTRAIQTPATAKKRYGRPLSSHSDADSGFLSPVTPCETTVAMQQHPPAAPNATTSLQQSDNFQRYITVSTLTPKLRGNQTIYQKFFFSFCVDSRMNSQIYTDWANNYLERAKSKKRVIDLSNDCRDGLLLADVIEAVTACKVPDLNKKPKNHSQMVSFSWQLPVPART